SLEDVLEENIEYERDISRVRNRIIVLGSGGKKLPDDDNEDGLTEELTHWLPIYPDHELSLSMDHVKQDGEVGYSDSYSIQVATGGEAPLNSTGAKYVFTSGPIKCGGAAGFKRLRFWLYWNRLFTGAPPQSIKVMLYTTVSDYYYQDITGIAGSQGEWRKIELSLESAWGVVGNPSWDQIIAVGFLIEFADDVYPLMRLDHIVFEDARFSAFQEDVGSQNSYGLRELTETDEELTSDDACLRRAKALLNHLKDPAEHLTVRSTVLDYGDSPILPGDMIHVPFLDGDYRVSSVEYYVDGQTQTLEVTLELGREPPLLADYLYGLRSTTVTVEKLARTKLGKETKLTRAPTGHDHAGDVLRPSAVNCNELTVAGKATADEIECNRLSVADPLSEITVSGLSKLNEVEANQITNTGKITTDELECNTAMTIAGTFTTNQVNCNNVSAAVNVTTDQVNCNNLNAAAGISANSINVNSLIVTGSVNCANWQAADITFKNKFILTEAENLGLPKGLAFLNHKKQLIAYLDEKGNLTLKGKLKTKKRLKLFES
ncbi:hypothetical protein H5T51_08590, partial [Candidatus Bathyarchaeota archaeon]|nr:hypothetical protein [Candidatus Bathyarchaeota archaeon]